MCQCPFLGGEGFSKAGVLGFSVSLREVGAVIRVKGVESLNDLLEGDAVSVVGVLEGDVVAGVLEVFVGHWCSGYRGE